MRISDWSSDVCSSDLRVIKSCSIFAMQSEGGTLETIEGVAPDDRTLHPMQVAFSQTLGLQCGYCTPGMLMLALVLIQENPDTTRSQERRVGKVCVSTSRSRWWRYP